MFLLTQFAAKMWKDRMFPTPGNVGKQRRKLLLAPFRGFASHGIVSAELCSLKEISMRIAPVETRMTIFMHYVKQIQERIASEAYGLSQSSASSRIPVYSLKLAAYFEPSNPFTVEKLAEKKAELEGIHFENTMLENFREGFLRLLDLCIFP